MRVLAISDLRVHDIRHVERIAERVQPDLILYAGDDVARFGAGHNSWSPLAQRTPLGLAGVIGNDCAGADAAAFDQAGCHDLHQAPLLFDGLAILGLQGAPADEGEPRGSTLYSRRQARAHLERQLAATGKRPVLLVSHTPPRGVLDSAIRFGLASIGSTVVRDTAKQARTRGIVCGHAHLMGGRVEQVGRCTVVNIASHDNVHAWLRYAILNWDGKRLRVECGAEKDHRNLAAIRGVGRARAERLQRAGFRSVDDLVDAAPDSLSRVCSNVHVARRLRGQARALRDGKPVLLERSQLFPEQALIVDVETSVDRKDDPWLVGFKHLGRGKVQQLQELDPSRHGAHLRRFGAAIVRGHVERFVQWGPFDRGALGRAHTRVNTKQPRWLQDERWMNACAWVERVVALPLPDSKLTTVARYFGYERAFTDLSGLEVGLQYSRYREAGTPFDVKKVRAYNRDDVLALEHVVRGVQALVASGTTLVEPHVDTQVRGVAKYRASLQSRVARGELTAHACEAAVTAYEASMRRADRRSRVVVAPTSEGLTFSQWQKRASKFRWGDDQLDDYANSVDDQRASWQSGKNPEDYAREFLIECAREGMEEDVPDEF
jgi:hypothetical protein